MLGAGRLAHAVEQTVSVGRLKVALPDRTRPNDRNNTPTKCFIRMPREQSSEPEPNRPPPKLNKAPLRRPGPRRGAYDLCPDFGLRTAPLKFS